MKNTNINLDINLTLLKSEKYIQSVLNFIIEWKKVNGKLPTVRDVKSREEFQDLFSFEIDCFIKQVEDMK